MSDNSPPTPIPEIENKKPKQKPKSRRKKEKNTCLEFENNNQDSVTKSSVMSANSSPKPIDETQKQTASQTKTKKKKEKKDKKSSNQDSSSSTTQPKRKKSPGVRVVGGRIYDSENGKTCHQCRQKTMDFVAACKVLKNEKPCTLNFCHKCLLNRYGENAEEVHKQDDWVCPKCRGICNCSFCMKKRGHKPTGILVRTAKKSGFASVSDMLQVNPPAPSEQDWSVALMNKQEEQIAATGENHSNHEIQSSRSSGENKKRKTSEKTKGNGNVSDRNQGDVSHSNRGTKKARKAAEVSANSTLIESRIDETDGAQSNIDIPLPLGNDVTTIAGVDVSAEDIGLALQFLEFCRAFGQILDLKQGQAEAVLKELASGSTRRRGQYSSLGQFHIQLLTSIQKDIGEESSPSSTRSGDSWLQALGRCISRSQCKLRDFPLDWFDGDGDGYEKLDLSKKLRLLNFLCDETLCTTSLRDWIDKQNLELVEREKAAKEKVMAAREKERQAKQKMQDEVAKATLLKNGAPLTVSEHSDLVSLIKAEVAKAQAERLEAMEIVPNKKQRSDAVRTESVYSDGDGHTFWRLKAYSAEEIILLQDIRSLDSEEPEERWFSYDMEQSSAVENYISSTRNKRRFQADHGILQTGDTEANIQPDQDILAQGEAVVEKENVE